MSIAGSGIRVNFHHGTIGAYGGFPAFRITLGSVGIVGSRSFFKDDDQHSSQ